MVPQVLTGIQVSFDGRARTRALSVLVMTMSGSAVIGQALGGPLIAANVLGTGWRSIFWVNVPIGIALIPVAASRLVESRGEVKRLDFPGLALVSSGLFGVVYGLVRSQSLGWSSTEVIVALAAGTALLVAFVWQELRTAEPMLPMEFFANRGFTVTNAVSIAMYFGMFGSIFFLSQFLQNVLHNTPLQAGVKLLVWTGAVMVVAPAAGFLSERYGSRMFMVSGLGLQAIALGLLAAMAGVHQASGATNAIRELGGVLGIAVLATVFTSHGSYVSPQAYVNGLVPAMWVGTAVLAAGALIALVFPFSTRASAAEHAAAEGAASEAHAVAVPA
jgi:MFS family permease